MKFSRLALLLVCVTAIFSGGVSLASQEGSSWTTEAEAATLVAEIHEFFKGAEVRLPGSPGNLAIEQKVAGTFEESGFEHGEISFRAPCFVPRKTTLSLAGHDPIRLLPMHPTLFRPGNFIQRAFSADLVYLGRGTEKDLMNVKGLPLRDAVALMEFNCGNEWQRLLRFGVKGFIFIEGDKSSRSDSVSKVYSTEVAVPRFFVSRQDGAVLKNALSQAGKAVQVNIHSEPSIWENRFLRNLWVFIPGSDKELEKEAILIFAPIDSNCVVPELRVGAQSGANLCLLMRIFDEFRLRPPARSVILAAVNAHTQKFLGERMLVWHLLASGEDVEAARDVMAADIRIQELIARTYSNLHLDGKHDEFDEGFLVKLRTLLDKSTGKFITLKDPVVTLARRDVSQLKAQQLDLATEGLSDAELEKRRQALEEKRCEYVNVLTLFNKFGIQTTLSGLSSEEREILKRYVREIVENNRVSAELNRGDLEISKNNSAIRNVLAGRSIPLVIGLDFDWQDTRIGFSSGDYWGDWKWPFQFGRNAVRIATEMKAIQEEGKKNLLVDTMTNLGGMLEGHFFPILSAEKSLWPQLSFFHAAGWTPAFSLSNVFTDGGPAFSPVDTFENLEPGNVAEIFCYVPEFLRDLLSDSKVTTPSELEKPSGIMPGIMPLWSVRIKSFKFDEFSSAVLPSIPVPGSVVILYDSGNAIVAGDVVNSYVSLTDERALTDFVGINSRELCTSAFHFDKNFVNVDHAIDAGEVHERVNSNLVKSDQLILVLFECEEFPIYERHDPSLISAVQIGVSSYHILDAQRNSAPRKYGFTGILSEVSGKRMPQDWWGPGAVFIEPRSRVKVLTENKRLALNAGEAVPDGEGYGTFPKMGPDFFRAAAADMSRLNRERMAKLRGVSDELVDNFLKQGDKKLRQIHEAEIEHDHIGYLRALYEALGAHVKAYQQVTATTNDMLKAVVFYMALMIPFCFFLQRLLFKTVKIEAQMGIFLALFILTYMVFRMIHPAFRIAKAPEAMFIAFVMGALGLFVINILHGRFEGEMQLLFHTYTAMDESEVGYSTVGQHAMLIGVNNMKRRRIRTTLTTGTIVLVTFTMLAFTSISRRLSPTIITTAKFAPYTGIMYHWPGTTMDESTMQVFKELFADRGKIIVRRWLLAPRRKSEWEQEKPQPLHVEAPHSGRSINVEAFLGLPAAEDGFLEKMPLISGGRFFSSDDADEAVVPASVAETLGITPEKLHDSRIVFNGSEMDVVGILHDERFRLIKDINDKPLLPVKSMLREVEPGTEMKVRTGEAMSEAGVFYVDTYSLIVVPVETCRRLGGAPFSISVRFGDSEPIWPVVKTLLMTSCAKFYMSSRFPFQAGEEAERQTAAGIYYIGSGYRTSIGGLARLIIPLLIASTLVMNTMLGSVFERKREIAIYNAIGLNPTHIGLFFLAESFVYAVIGSVGGYLIGQVLSIALNRFGLVSDINLNFSSLSVVYVILFTIGIVLLSTLYPAIVATRAAVPSGKRKWSMPQHEGERMEVAFPFIYQHDLLPGVMNYLEEYFARYTEVSLGDMITELEEKSSGKDEDGRDTYYLKYSVALAPYDLGVTQKVNIQAGYDWKVQAHTIVMSISRTSGQDSNWVTTNKPFLEKLRQYLMHWRDLDSVQRALYVEHGKQSFGVTVHGSQSTAEGLLTQPQKFV